MDSSERYSLIWQQCGENSDISKRFFIPEYIGYLPFFIWGEDLIEFENKKKVKLREEHLLKGILYGLYEFDVAPLVQHHPEDKKTLMYLLDILGNGFNFESPEKMILDVAGSVRENNGNPASSIILKVGDTLIHASSKIKSDLICDLWAVSCSQDDNNEIFKEILNLIQQIDLTDINPAAKENVCYYGFCATVFMKADFGISKYLETYVYPNIEKRQLKDRIKALLENPEDYEPVDLLLP